MNPRTRSRGISTTHASGYLRLANTPNLSTLRPGFTILNRFSNLTVTPCFLTTNTACYRLTDLAYSGLIEHYVRSEAALHGDMNLLKIKATTMGVMALGWMHTPSTIAEQPALEYVRINKVLSRIAIPYQYYTKILASWSQSVSELAVGDEVGATLRGAYHVQQLHYMVPRFAGAESADLITNFCNLDLPDDMVVPANFAVATLTEENWVIRWKELTLIEKIRWYELVGIVDHGYATKRANSYIVGALFAICKMGTMEESWLTNRMQRVENQGHIQLDRTIITREVLSVVFEEFVTHGHVNCYDIYNNLLARYYHGSISDIAPINWVIEQTSMAGAATVTLIADVVKSHRLSYSTLIRAGVPREEFIAWSTAVCQLSRNRLIAIAKSPINSAQFRMLQVICKEVVGAGSFRDYHGGDGRATIGDLAIAKQIANMARAITSARLQTAVSPESLLRTLHNRTVEVLPDGRVRSRVIGNQENREADADLLEAASVAELLNMCPPTPQDVALFALCDHALMTGQQDKWTLRSLDDVESPNREVPFNIVEAAHLLGSEWVNTPDDYQMPPELGRGVIYPPWDLGCITRQVIPRPPGGGPRGGGGGRGDDDDDGDDHDEYPDYNPGLDSLSENLTVQVLSGRCTLAEAMDLLPAQPYRAPRVQQDNAGAAVEPEQVVQPEPLSSAISAIAPAIIPADSGVAVDVQVPGPSGTRPLPLVYETIEEESSTETVPSVVSALDTGKVQYPHSNLII